MTTAAPQRPETSAHRAPMFWTVLAVAEIALAATVVALDRFVPSFVVLGVMVVSLLVRRRGLGSLGLHRTPHVLRLAAGMFAAALAWTVLDAGLLKPIENHLTGTRQDMSQFEAIEGNIGLLLAWLALAWVVAGFGETLAFIGFLQTRMTDVLGGTGLRLVLASLATSVLLGLLHTEYGIVGVTISTVDGLFYCFLRYRFRTLWAPILAHGFTDTIGLVTVFLVGPVYALW